MEDGEVLARLDERTKFMADSQKRIEKQLEETVKTLKLIWTRYDRLTWKQV